MITSNHNKIAYKFSGLPLTSIFSFYVQRQKIKKYKISFLVFVTSQDLVTTSRCSLGLGGA